MLASSRENVINSINHREPEKMAVDFGSNAVTGIHVKAVEGLRAHYGLEKRPVRVIEPFQLLGEVEEDLAAILGADVIGTYGVENMFGFSNGAPFKEFRTHWGQVVRVPENFNTTPDGKGGLLMYPGGDLSLPPSARMPADSYFFDAIIRQEPVDDATLKVEDNLQEFGLVKEADLEHWKTVATEARASGKAVMASLGGTALGDIALVPGMQLKHPKGIRDVAEWYMSTVMRSDYVKEIFHRQTDIAIENYKKYAEVLGDLIDVVFTCGTDFGTQDSTFCSIEQYEDLWMPYYKRMNDWIHENTTWKTFKHSCGAVKSFIPAFIESGFDILNPVQINAAGMDPVELKREFGKDICFWGGGADTQKVLPYASPGEVKREILKLCRNFAPGGGFVFNTVHNIQANVPVENIVAMVEAIAEFNS